MEHNYKTDDSEVRYFFVQRSPFVHQTTNKITCARFNLAKSQKGLFPNQDNRLQFLRR